MNSLVRNGIGLLFWSAMILVTLVINMIIIFSNYFSCSTAFELSGYEPKPLKADQLGANLDLFLSDVTLAQFYALGISLTLGVAFFILFRLIHRLLELLHDRRVYSKQDDVVSAEAVLLLIIQNIVMIVIMLIPIYFLVRWDIELFRFRSVAGALQITDPSGVSTIEAWDLQLKNNASLFSWKLIQYGAWGYIAGTALACFCLEFSIRKLEECWVKLLSGIEKLSQSKTAETDYYNHAHSESSYEQNSEWTDSSSLDQPAPETYNQPDDDVYQDSSEPKPLSDNELLGDLEDEQESTTDTEVPSEVSGKEGESITLSQALKQPELFYVKPSTGEIWDRSVWDSINSTDENTNSVTD